MDRNLRDDEIAYLGDLAWRFIEERMPDLPDEPQKVPGRRAGWVSGGRST